jgi:hypothetical protein
MGIMDKHSSQTHTRRGECIEAEYYVHDEFASRLLWLLALIRGCWVGSDILATALCLTLAHV